MRGISSFSKNAGNLVPILSMEGTQEQTDNRRGSGVYQRLVQAAGRLHESGILFGVSVTVTTENLNEVTSDDFLKRLKHLGCKVVLYVEYVPVGEESKSLAPGDEERAALAASSI